MTVSLWSACQHSIVGTRASMRVCVHKNYFYVAGAVLCRFWGAFKHGRREGGTLSITSVSICSTCTCMRVIKKSNRETCIMALWNHRCEVSYTACTACSSILSWTQTQTQFKETHLGSVSNLHTACSSIHPVLRLRLIQGDSPCFRLNLHTACSSILSWTQTQTHLRRLTLLQTQPTHSMQFDFILDSDSDSV
jgi:hypothetical protein